MHPSGYSRYPIGTAATNLAAAPALVSPLVGNLVVIAAGLDETECVFQAAARHGLSTSAAGPTNGADARMVW
ncbi:MAG: hypothetical protein ACK6CT_03820 [Planctomycetia bacterium]|jgi:hypothetical protein